MANVHVVGTKASSGRAVAPGSTDVVGMSSMVRVIARSTTIESDESAVAKTTAWRPSGSPATSSDENVTTSRAGTAIGSTGTPSAMPRNSGVHLDVRLGRVVQAEPLRPRRAP